MFTRVRASLLLWNLAIISVILLAAGTVTYLSQQRSLLGDVDQLLIVAANAQPGPDLSAGPTQIWVDRQVPFALVVDQSGHVLADPQRLGVQAIAVPGTRPDSLANRLNVFWNRATPVEAMPVAQTRLALLATEAGKAQQQVVARAVPSADPSGYRTITSGTIQGQPVRLLASPVVFQRVAQPDSAQPVPTAAPVPLTNPGVASQTPNAVLVTGVSLVPMEQSLHQTLIVLLIGGAAGVLLSLVGSWFLAGRALIPIETAYRRQQEFVADAAHELRTPLTILQTSAHLLNQHRHEPLDAQAVVFDDLHDEIGRLTRLTCDLLDLARSDLGQLSLTLGRVDLGQLAQAIVRRLEPSAAERRIALGLAGPDQPIVVDADADRLQQAILVLLDNALKHTQPGGAVTLEISATGRGVTLKVRDTGEGMSPDILQRVFDRFYRGDPGRSRTTEGVGLGLAIAQTLVKAHAGTLTLSSVLGRGTTATIQLPAH
jgi:signal transduction histidine kinase